MDFTVLGKKIRTERKYKRLTQEGLAGAVGISPNFLGQIERGERKLSIETLVSISRSLDVSADYLLSEGPDASEDALCREILTDLSEMDLPRKQLLRDFIRRYKEI